MYPSSLITKTSEVGLQGFTLSLFDVCQAAPRLGVYSSNLELADKFIGELNPTLDRIGWELLKPFLCYLRQGDSEAATFGQITYLEEVHLIIERIQVIVWISFSLITWYLWHLESVGKGFLLNFSSKGGVIVITHSFGPEGQVFNPCS